MAGQRVRLAPLRQGDGAALLDHGRHALEGLGRRQVHLVEEQPVALAQRLHECAFDKGEGHALLARPIHLPLHQVRS